MPSLIFKTFQRNMNKITLLKTLLVSILLTIGSVVAIADTYSYTFSAVTWTAYGDKTLSNVTWTAAGTSGAFFGYDANNTPSKGQQFGSSSYPATTLGLTTSGIQGTITSVKINTCGASSIAGAVAIAVGGTSFTIGSSTSQVLTSTSTNYTFTGSGNGSVVISWTQTSSKAIYIKSIEVTYSVVPTSVPVVSPASLNATVGSVFSSTISATNMPTGYAIASGTLPTGLSLNTTTGSIAGTPTAAGSSSVTVTATNVVGTSTPATIGFNIVKGNQTITFGALESKTNQDIPFNLTATASSGLAVSYASSNTNVATVSGSTITIKGVGSTTITASQAGNDNYNAATSVDQNLAIIQYVAPTFTMTEILVPDFSAYSGSSSSQLVNVSGVNLTGNVILSLSGTNANQFSLSSTSAAQTGGIVPNTVFTVNYVPTSIGTHVATLTFSSAGAISVTRSLSGTASIVSGLNKLQVLSDIIAANGEIRFSAQSGEKIEIYNTIGQKILYKQAIDGENTVQLSTRGVLVIKVGNRIGKVIL